MTKKGRNWKNIYSDELDISLLKEDSIDNLKRFLIKLKQDKQSKEQEKLPGTFEVDS